MNIINMGTFTTTEKGKFYDYFISSKDGEPLAFKEHGKEWVVRDAPKALSMAFEELKRLHEQINKKQLPIELTSEKNA